MGPGSDHGPPEDSFDDKEKGTILEDAKGRRPSTIPAAAG